MKGFTYGKSEDIEIVILMKEDNLNKSEIEFYYINPLKAKLKLNDKGFLVLGLPFKTDGKRPLTGKEREELIQGFTKIIGKTKCKLIIIADSKYKHLLTRKYKGEDTKKLIADNKTPMLGLMHNCLIEGLEGISITQIPSTSAIAYDPSMESIIEHCIEVICNHLKGVPEVQSQSIKEDRIVTLSELKTIEFNQEVIACDIEGFGLKFFNAGLGTIGFAFSEYEGFAIDVEHSNSNSKEEIAEIKQYLKQIFIEARKTNGKVRFLFHGLNYDVPALIFELFMNRDINNLEGMLEGLDVFKYSLCSKLSLFLDSNNAIKNTLDLKTAVMPFLGNYGLDVKDITKLESKELLEYNSKDCRGTLWLFNRTKEVMIKDNQLKLHDELLRPSLLVYCKMILTGMALDLDRVVTSRKSLKRELWYLKLKLGNSSLIEDAEQLLKEEALDKTRLKISKQIKEKEEYLKEKEVQLFGKSCGDVTTDWLNNQINQIEEQIKVNKGEGEIEQELKLRRSNMLNLRLHKNNLTKLKCKLDSLSIEDIKDIEFNVNSGNHLIKLIYGVMDAPVLDYTDTGLPSTEASVMKRLQDILNDEYSEVVKLISESLKIEKVLNTFIKALMTESIKHDNAWFIHGGINPQGTLSGRPSSSEPNLLNLPSGGKLGKLVKSCFVAPKGWVMCCADFGALESRCDAIVTQDPAKRKVYVQGYDGHCLNTYAYFRDELPSDMGDSVEEVNSIETEYPELRQKAKAPYFLLIYNGGLKTLMRLGFTESEARTIMNNHMELYKASEAHSLGVLKKCSEQGYYDVAFGLRVRTPNLKGVNVNSLTEQQASVGRTINNAKTQSYSLLLNRATMAMESNIKEAKYEKDILIMNTIYDAVYYLVRENPETISWLNNNLIKEMEWQELESLKDPEIPMTSKLEIGYSWDRLQPIPNGCDIETINTTLKELKNEY